MAVNERPQWTAVEVAARAMNATSLSELTLPEVKRMAARILDDERNAPQPNRTDPKPAEEPNLREVIAEEFEKGWAKANRRLD